MKVSELKDKEIWVIYGLPEDPDRYSVDLYKEFTSRINLGALSVLDMDVNISIHYPGDPYLRTDRTIMPPNYPCMGSASAHFSIGKQSAAIAVAHFQDVDDVHNQSLLYWRDFDGKMYSSKDASGHQMDPKKDVHIKIRLDDQELNTTFPKMLLKL